MTWRLIQKPAPKLTIGFALGWGLPYHLDGTISKALPGWAIVAQDAAPRSVVFKDYAAARLMSGTPREAPLILFGVGQGCLSVRTVLLSGFLDVWGVGAVDVPPLDAADPSWALDVWTQANERSALVMTSSSESRATFGAFDGMGNQRTIEEGISMLSRIAPGPPKR
jgi:hypothetical protein